jgi:hypothetical protein
MGEIAVTIRVVNEATPEFEAITSDAARMASEVGAQAVTIRTENLASPEINRVAEDAARVKAEVEGSPITIAFAPIEVPSIPAIEVPPVETSFAPIEPPVIPPLDSPTVTVNFAPIDVPPLPPIDTTDIQDSLHAVEAAAIAASSTISSLPFVVTAQNLASPEIDKIAEDVATVKAQVEGAPITMTFAPVEIPAIPIIEVPSIQTSFAPVEVPTIPPIEAPTVTVNFAPIDVPVLPSLDTSPIEDSLNRVTAAAMSMSSTVSAQLITIQAQDLASPEISKVADTAASVKASIEAAPITITFAPIEVPPLPPLDTTPIQASLNEVGVAATGMGADVEAASTSFDDMSAHAEATMVSLRTVAGGIRTTAMMGTELTTLAADFGIVDKETSKYIRTIMLVIMIVSTAARMYNFLTVMTTGHTAALAVETTTETGAAVAETSHSVAHGIYAAACNIATMAENALNISHATFLALTGVGIAVIIAAAAAVSIFASQMNAATASVKGYNAAAAETPTVTRGITRAGEQAMYRRGVE